VSDADVLRPTASHRTVDTGAPIGPVGVTVAHLSAGVVSLYSGVRRSGGADCGPATLHVDVALPRGVESHPFVAARGGGSVPLDLHDGRATVDVASWSTCPGRAQAAIVLPNATETVDGIRFVVTLTVTAAGEPTAAAPPHGHRRKIARNGDGRVRKPRAGSARRG
jgi:hypothetical protein